MQFAQCLDAERMRGDVDQDRPDVDAGDQSTLDGGSHGNGQVRFDLGVDRPPEPFFQQLVDQGCSRCPTDQDDLVDLVGLHLGVVESLVQAGQRFQEQGSDQLLVFVPGDLQHQVQRFVAFLGDELFLDSGHRVE